MDRKSILKKVRPEYLLVLFLAAACVYTLYSSFAKTKDEKTTYSYTESLEEKLSKALSKVEGAAKVTVVITVSGGAETVIAEDKTVTTENGKRSRKLRRCSSAENRSFSGKTTP